MNILHMKYAVAVAATGSINKAASQLYIAQPNLSRCIKELEADLGILIFERTFKGMTLTPDGREFIHYAKNALREIDQIEQLYKSQPAQRRRFSISVPKSSHYSEAFVRFTKELALDSVEIEYKEANFEDTVRGIMEGECQLGILRYASEYDKFFLHLLEMKGLRRELIAEYQLRLIMSRQSRLAGKKQISLSDLKDLIEIVHDDKSMNDLRPDQEKNRPKENLLGRRIFLYDQRGQYELLSDNPDTYMWSVPFPGRELERFQLIQKRCSDEVRSYRDVFVCLKGYQLSQLDRQFTDRLKIYQEEWPG